MASRFLPSDRQRVEEEFNDVLPDGYMAIVKIEADGTVLSVTVMDPAAAGIVLCSVRFDFEQRAPALTSAREPQPAMAEVIRVKAIFADECNRHKEQS